MIHGCWRSHPAHGQEPISWVGGCQVALEWIDGWDKAAKTPGECGVRPDPNRMHGAGKVVATDRG